MIVLLTNDDGIDAPGLEALAACCANLGRLVVVAPEVEQSGISHRVTSHGHIRVDEVANDRYRVAGTPADCVRLGLRHLCPDASLVVSGINRGGNLGMDIYMSGTVAAAREAYALGTSAIALSQYIAKGRDVDWSHTAKLATQALDTIQPKGTERLSLYNVNLPHPPPSSPDPDVEFCDPDPKPMDVRFETSGSHHLNIGDYHQRPRTPGHDVDVCFGGRIAISRLGLFGQNVHD